MSERYSRTDIQVLCLLAGMTYEQAEDLACDLSPECQTVPANKVKKILREWRNMAQSA